MHRIGGTYSQICMMETPRYAISELHSRNFQTQMTFSVGESTSRPSCVCTPFPQFTMSWVNEVEVGGSTDDLMASQTIRGKTFPDFEMLDARIVSAFRKIICSTSAGRRLCVEEQRAQKKANCLCDLWAFSVNRSSRYSSRSVGFVQYLLAG